MLFTNTQSNTIYDMLYDWLSVYTPGEHRNISTLKEYQKKTWGPIVSVIKDLSSKTELTKEEHEFIDLTTYNGEIFRIQNYHSRYNGYIYESSNYQSWSQNINGVSNVTNMSGSVLLIVGTASNGINIFGLLSFLFKYRYITSTHFKNPENLLRYEEEQEIAYPLKISSINIVKKVEKEKLSEWQTHGIDIPRSKWRRNTFR